MRVRKNLKKMVELSKRNGAKPLIIGMRIPPNYGKAYSEKFFNIFKQVAYEKKIAIGTRCLLFSFNSASFILSIIITNKNTIAIAPT